MGIPTVLHFHSRWIWTGKSSHGKASCSRQDFSNELVYGLKLCWMIYKHYLFVLFSFLLYRFQRPSGPIPSSMLGLEVYTGAIDDFGFEDYLNGNCPFYSPIAIFSICYIHFSISVGTSLIVSQYALADRFIFLL